MSIQPDTIISILIGGLITWFAAHLYYARAAKDMEAESKKLRNLHRISLQAMEDAGMVKINRDAAGEIIGMVHELSAHAVITSRATAELTVLNEVEEGHDSK
jgi:hypothetical protein